MVIRQVVRIGGPDLAGSLGFGQGIILQSVLRDQAGGLVRNPFAHALICRFFPIPMRQTMFCARFFMHGQTPALT